MVYMDLLPTSHLSLPLAMEKRRDCVYIGSLGKLANGFLSGSPTTDQTENDRCHFGGRDGIRTHDLLIANSGENKLRQGATIT
jgi:hypothetical protein